MDIAELHMAACINVNRAIPVFNLGDEVFKRLLVAEGVPSSVSRKPSERSVHLLDKGKPLPGLSNRFCQLAPADSGKFLQELHFKSPVEKTARNISPGKDVKSVFISPEAVKRSSKLSSLYDNQNEKNAEKGNFPYRVAQASSLQKNSTCGISQLSPCRHTEQSKLQYDNHELKRKLNNQSTFKQVNVGGHWHGHHMNESITCKDTIRCSNVSNRCIPRGTERVISGGESVADVVANERKRLKGCDKVCSNDGQVDQERSNLQTHSSCGETRQSSDLSNHHCADHAHTPVPSACCHSNDVRRYSPGNSHRPCSKELSPNMTVSPQNISSASPSPTSTITQHTPTRPNSVQAWDNTNTTIPLDLPPLDEGSGEDEVTSIGAMDISEMERTISTLVAALSVFMEIPEGCGSAEDFKSLQKTFYQEHLNQQASADNSPTAVPNTTKIADDSPLIPETSQIKQTLLQESTSMVKDLSGAFPSGASTAQTQFETPYISSSPSQDNSPPTSSSTSLVPDMFAGGDNMTERMNLLIHHVLLYFEMKIKEMVKFAKCIPDFKSLNINDQAALLRESRVESAIIGGMKGIDTETGLFTASHTDYFTRDEMTLLFPAHSVEQKVRLSKRIRDAELSKEEEALLRAIAITFTDRCPLVNRNRVQSIQNKLITCLLHVMRKQRCNIGMRMAKLFNILIDMRYITEVDMKVMRDRFLQLPKFNEHVVVQEFL